MRNALATALLLMSAAFAASFYRALGFGRSVKNAFDQGVAAIMMEGLGDQAVPSTTALPLPGSRGGVMG
jgi:hypothetical protein